MDKRIKGSLIANMFNLIGIIPYQSDNQREKLEDQRKNAPKEWMENWDAFFCSLTSQQWERVIFDLEDEFARRGHFECKPI